MSEHNIKLTKELDLRQIKKLFHIGHVKDHVYSLPGKSLKNIEEWKRDIFKEIYMQCFYQVANDGAQIDNPKVRQKLMADWCVSEYRDVEHYHDTKLTAASKIKAIIDSRIKDIPGAKIRKTYDADNLELSLNKVSFQQSVELCKEAMQFFFLDDKNKFKYLIYTHAAIKEHMPASKMKAAYNEEQDEQTKWADRNPERDVKLTVSKREKE